MGEFHALVEGLNADALIPSIAAYWAPRLAQALYLLVALLWFIPDRRIENVIATKP
jgi:hypothetical protein